MTTYRFASISGKPVGYTLHAGSTDLWDAAYRTAHVLSPKFGWYHTGGDGLTQHDVERVVTVEQGADYLASLAAFIMHVGTTMPEADRRSIAYVWPSVPAPEAIAFALSVVHKPGPYRYFNLAERKVSARPALAHDKRWHLIRERHNGSVSGAMSVLTEDDRDRIHFVAELYAQWDALRIAYVAREGWTVKTSDELFEKDPDTLRRQFEVSWDLAELAMQALRACVRVDVALWNYEQRSKRERDANAELAKANA